MRLSAVLTPLLLLALTLDTGCMQRERTNVDVDTPAADGGKDVPGATGSPAGGATGGVIPGGSSAATPPGVQTFSGNLAQGDQQLQSGEFVDWYPVQGVAGQTITIDMASTSSLDPYLLLRGPAGQEQDNDDLNGDRTRSQIVHTVTEAGTFQVGATSYQPGETGTYTVTVAVGQGFSGPMPTAPTGPPPTGGK